MELREHSILVTLMLSLTPITIMSIYALSYTHKEARALWGIQHTAALGPDQFIEGLKQHK